jgi:short-subunit dehydrogenase
MKTTPLNSKTVKGTALVTGASAGIGATYADRLAKRGYNLILVARDIKRLDALAARLTQETGVQVETFQADLVSKADLARVERRLREDDQITLLVNNAGMSAHGSLVGGDVDAHETMIHLNVIAPTRLTAAVATRFAANGTGTIINIASVLALAPELFNGVYSGTKAYLLNLSLSLHKELGPKGVRVQAVLPGATRTEIWEKAGVDANHFPPGFVMEVDVMVDAALAGLDLGELVTIPPLPNMADFETFNNARLALGPNLSKDRAADRYQVAQLAAA